MRTGLKCVKDGSYLKLCYGVRSIVRGLEFEHGWISKLIIQNSNPQLFTGVKLIQQYDQISNTVSVHNYILYTQPSDIPEILRSEFSYR